MQQYLSTYMIIHHVKHYAFIMTSNFDNLLSNLKYACYLILSIFIRLYLTLHLTNSQIPQKENKIYIFHITGH